MVYFMDSGLIKSYPATGIVGQAISAMNYKFKPGTACVKCGQAFQDGDVATRGKWEGRSGFRHEACGSTLTMRQFADGLNALRKMGRR